jgi:lipopolysaccharide transport system ATP-binding protein
MTMPTVISIEHLSKSYHLGQIGTGTLTNDFKVWWAKVRGQPNPMLKIGQADHGNRKGEELLALQDVNFTVRQGEVLGIIGRNGAGKSTILKILSRVTAPTSGKIKVKGRVASLLEVGTGFHSDLTGRENIYLNGAIFGMSRKEIDRKFDEIVDFSEVEKFIDTPVKRYSSGMFVRLAFAVAAHLDPEILVVDEVLAVGDAEFQKKCLGKMGDVAKEGRTVLFVSHNMTTVQNLCTRGILLESGKLTLTGSVQTVIEYYLSRAHQAAKAEGTNLENWSDRAGSGRAKIIRFDILDRKGNPIHEIAFNDIVRFRITCNFPDAIEAAFGVLIHSLAEVPLIDLRSSNSGLKTGKLSGQVVIETEVDALNLYPGEYYLSPWIADRMMKEDIDFVHYCAKLAVTMPIGQTHILKLDPTWGKVVVDSRWNIKR